MSTNYTTSNNHGRSKTPIEGHSHSYDGGNFHQNAKEKFQEIEKNITNKNSNIESVFSPTLV